MVAVRRIRIWSHRSLRISRKIAALNEQLERAKADVEQAERQGDLNKAAELRYADCVRGFARIKTDRKRSGERHVRPLMLSFFVILASGNSGARMQRSKLKPSFVNDSRASA